MKSKILTIEAIRGSAAWYVFFGHLVLLYQPYSFLPSSEFLIKTMFGYGGEAVLLFFIVSGFSIHYSTIFKQSSFPKSNPTEKYFYKRFKRIYPIFFISLLFSILALILIEKPLERGEIIFSFLFLTDLRPNSISDPISTNPVIWSLSYEIFYYILYIPFLRLSKIFGLKYVFLFSVLISFIAYFSNHFIPNHLSNLLEMYWLWTAGAYLAHLYTSKTNFLNSYFVAFFMISSGFMLTLENVFTLKEWAWGVFFILIIFSGLPNVTVCNKRNPYFNYFLGLSGLLICYYLTFFNNILYHPSLLRLLIPILAFLGFFLIFIDVKRLINYFNSYFILFSKSGGYSYALYIIHWPIIILMLNYFGNFLNQFYFLIFIIIFNIIIVLHVAKFLDFVFQPKISKFLDSKTQKT